MGMNSVTLTAHPCHTGARLFSGIDTQLSSLVWDYLRDDAQKPNTVGI